MKKRWKALILGLACLTLCGCNVFGVSRTNDPNNLQRLPYTFIGSSDAFVVRITLRAVDIEDVAMLAESPDEETTRFLLSGYRSVFQIAYEGDAQIVSFSYSFARDTQWYTGGNLSPRQGHTTVNEALTGEADLGGNFYSADARTGGPIPPYSGEYLFELTAKTAQGEILHESFTLQAE